MKIAIVGGGLAGASLAIALVRIHGLEIQVYESSPEFSERGAGVGLATNAQRALEQILPPGESTHGLLNRAGAVTLNPSRFMMGSGPDAGAFVCDLNSDCPAKAVNRSSLLRELLALLPSEILHANKKVTAMNPRLGGLEIVFEDGDVQQFDGIIGADGVFGSCRLFVLGGMVEAKHAQGGSPSPAGFWDCRNVVPFEKATSILGNDYLELDRAYGWIGKGAFIMTDVLEERTLVQCVICSVEPDGESPQDRTRSVTRELLLDIFSDWEGGPIARAAIEIMLDQPDPKGYSEWEHKMAPTYANGLVCIIGDAAHTTTPFQGSGASLALEDAMILGTLLENISSPNEISKAFQAFSDVRVGRCQQVIDSSRETGALYCGLDRRAGLDVTQLKKASSSKWEFIVSLDMEAHKSEAIQRLDELRE
ncbi:salicylate hydroxylase [Xylariaceae sp. FL0662B]|nr:salicylate hydroxylase [Xylariaceae sp. FL0662B]